MRCLVTGAAGFIGSYLMQELPHAVGCDIKWGRDVRDTNKLIEFIENYGIDHIVHLAAFASVPESWENPNKFIENNILGAMSVIKAALATGVKKIVHSSSSSCSEPSSSPYAVSKYGAELLFQAYKDQIEIVNFRFLNVYGKGQNYASPSAVQAFAEDIKKGKVTIYGDGEQTRYFIHVKDVCRAIHTALEKKLESGIVIDLGGRKPISINDLAKTMIKLLGKEVSIVHKEGRKEVRHSTNDYHNALTKLGFQPEISLEEGLKEILWA